MPPDPEFILDGQTDLITIALEPALNNLNSLMLFNRVEHLSGFDTWVTETLNVLTPEQLYNNRMVLIGLHYAMMPERGWPTFPAYVDHLARRDPFDLRDQLLRKLCQIMHEWADPQPPTPPTPEFLLASADNYLNYLEQYFPSPGDMDIDLEREAYALLLDPPAMQSLIVAHLGEMWDTVLKREWQRVEPMLREAVGAFQQIDYGGLSLVEMARRITRQEHTAKWEHMLEEFEQVYFVPSAHVGPYLGKFATDRTLWVFFGAHLPEGAQTKSHDLSRSELLVRLNALADDTRLRILGLVAREGELCAQDIITLLDLSQSAASRHLRQLSATGYLAERRREGAKCYSLNVERVDDTLNALERFLLPK